MKKIISFILVLLCIFGCSNYSNSNKKYSHKGENNQTNVNENINSGLYINFLTLLKDIEIFDGYAYVGNLRGLCYMMLTQNSNKEEMLYIKYLLINPFSEINDQAEEHYRIYNFQRKSSDQDGYGVKNPKNYAKSFFYSDIVGVKGRLNNKSFSNYSAPGKLRIFLDTVSLRIEYVVFLESNASYQGSKKISEEKYTRIRSFFDNCEYKGINKENNEIILNEDRNSNIDNGLNTKELSIIRRFINCVFQEDKIEISKMVSFPLHRTYPLPIINNRQEFIDRYDEIFDDSLKQIIINSNPKTDWSKFGWRGIFLNEGVIILNEYGEISSIHYESKIEKDILKKVIDKEKNQLHNSIKEFYKSDKIIETSTYRIRIDNMGNENYRYAAWKLDQKMSDKPNLIIKNGLLISDGTGGNHHFEFKNGEFVYECYINILRGENDPDANLIVYRNKKIILSQNASIVHVLDIIDK